MNGRAGFGKSGMMRRASLAVQQSGLAEGWRSRLPRRSNRRALVDLVATLSRPSLLAVQDSLCLPHLGTILASYQLNSSMQPLKPDKQILKNIKRYLQKEGRVSFELRELSELLRFSPLRLYTPRLLDTPLCESSLLKLFLLLHRILIQNPGECEAIGHLLTHLKCSSHGSLEQMLEQKLTKPYRLYLQRRVMLQMQWRSDRGLGESEGEESEARVYQLLNIINLATSFCDVIYTFGRYYLQRFGWAIDFNIVLGADLNGVYEEMVRRVRRPAKRGILDEIESVHEKMYVVFYNCYFHKYLKSYIPKWVNTDVYAIEMRRRAQTPLKDAKSTLSTRAPNRSFSSLKPKSRHHPSPDLADSCLFLNDRLEEHFEDDPEFVQSPQSSFEKAPVKCAERGDDPANHERLKLLMSMERVVGRCEK